MKVLVFGEILFDIFGDDKKIGGAPFNFASHMSKLGADVDMVSALGRDALGETAREYVRAFGVNEKYIAESNLPTGYCRVTLDSEGHPKYDLVRGVAYDAIEPPMRVGNYDAFYFGTLAARDERSKSALSKTLGRGDYKEVFFDINIRQNYYTKELIETLLRACTIFKVSREEIGVLGFKGSLEDTVRALDDRYPNLKKIIVTLDSDGALVYDCIWDVFTYSDKPVGKVVSTVGAGDSFSACFLYNYINGESDAVCLERANALASFVVGNLGAIPDYTDELIAKIK